jgi:hypothetical protein
MTCDSNFVDRIWISALQGVSTKERMSKGEKGGIKRKAKGNCSISDIQEKRRLKL